MKYRIVRLNIFSGEKTYAIEYKKHWYSLFWKMIETSSDQLHSTPMIFLSKEEAEEYMKF